MKMISKDLTVVLLSMMLIIVDSQLFDNGLPSTSEVTELHPISSHLPRTSIAPKMTQNLASSNSNNIVDESRQYRHYQTPHAADNDGQYRRDHDYDSSAASLQPLTTTKRKKKSEGVSGPVHTYIKTDKHANFKWGVRHYAGRRYRG